ncbi:hypothetical protein EMGR_006550, partial [Emarellia grisea]
RYQRIASVVAALFARVVRLAFAMDVVQNACGAVAGRDRGDAQSDRGPYQPPFAGNAQSLPRL